MTTKYAAAAAALEQILASMPADDAALAREILAAPDQWSVSELIRAYYGDFDRAERTPRGLMYVHMGMLNGIVLSALKVQA